MIWSNSYDYDDGMVDGIILKVYGSVWKEYYV